MSNIKTIITQYPTGLLEMKSFHFQKEEETVVAPKPYVPDYVIDYILEAKKTLWSTFPVLGIMKHWAIESNWGNESYVGMMYNNPFNITDAKHKYYNLSKNEVIKKRESTGDWDTWVIGSVKYIDGETGKVMYNRIYDSMEDGFRAYFYLIVKQYGLTPDYNNDNYCDFLKEHKYQESDDFKYNYRNILMKAGTYSEYNADGSVRRKDCWKLSKSRYNDTKYKDL